MKVCIIYYSFLGPLLYRDASAHVERGDEVDVICLRFPGEEEKDLAGINIHGLFERKFDEKHPLDYLKKLAKFWFLSFYKVSIWHLKKRYDLIHIISPPDFMAFVALIPKLLGAKVILNIHDIVPEFYMRKFGVQENHTIIKALKLIERISARFSDHVFTVTEIWKDKLIQRGLPKFKCSVLMNVPDEKVLNLIKNKKRISSYSSKFRLIYPGTLGEHFGVETLIRSMPIIKKEIPSIQLDIYGDGHQREFLLKLAKELGVKDVINFHSPIPIEELFLVMQQMDIGIVPTRDGIYSGEILPMKSLELIAMGIPIVISRTEGSQYYYDDSMVMFFEPDNHEDLARAVLELYKSPQKRTELIKNSIKFTKIHNWERYKKTYFNVVDSITTN